MVSKCSHVRVIEDQFVPLEPKLVRVIGSYEKSRFEKSEVKFKSLGEANSMQTRFGSRYREVRETEGSRNRDFTVFMWLNLFRLSTRNGAIINKNSQTRFLTNFDVNDFCSFCPAPQNNLVFRKIAWRNRDCMLCQRKKIFMPM